MLYNYLSKITSLQCALGALGKLVRKTAAESER